MCQAIGWPLRGRLLTRPSCGSAVVRALIVGCNLPQREQLRGRQLAPVDRVTPDAKAVPRRVEDETVQRTRAWDMRGVGFIHRPRASLGINEHARSYGMSDAMKPS